VLIGHVQDEDEDELTMCLLCFCQAYAGFFYTVRALGIEGMSDLDNFYDTVKNFCQSHWTVVSSSNGYRWKEEEKDRLERRRRREQGEFRKKTNRSKVNVGMRKNCRGEKDFICSLYSPSGAANWTKGQPRHTITLLTDNSAEERSSPK